MKLPTKQECIELWDEYDLPENIRQHVLLVTKIAVFLANELVRKGEAVDVELVEKAALLHDIDKIQTIGENALKHGYVSYDILIGKGYPIKLAELVKYHRVEAFKDLAHSWELKCLRYADARSLGDKIVSLDERFEYLRNRYPHLRLEENRVDELVLGIEKEICLKIGIKPEELKEKLG